MWTSLESINRFQICLSNCFCCQTPVQLTYLTKRSCHFFFFDFDFRTHCLSGWYIQTTKHLYWLSLWQGCCGLKKACICSVWLYAAQGPWLNFRELIVIRNDHCHQPAQQPGPAQLQTQELFLPICHHWDEQLISHGLSQSLCSNCKTKTSVPLSYINMVLNPNCAIIIITADLINILTIKYKLYILYIPPHLQIEYKCCSLSIM